MKRGNFIAGRCGQTVNAPGLPAVIPVLVAVMMDDCRRIRCDGLYITDHRPVAALCRELVDRGTPDTALLVRWQDGTSAGIILSIASMAADTRPSETVA